MTMSQEMLEDAFIKQTIDMGQLKVEIELLNQRNELLNNRLNQLETWYKAHLKRIENPHRNQL